MYVHLFGVCGQDCELSFGPIFTEFDTQLYLNTQKKRFLAVPKISVSELVISHPFIACREH